MRGWQMAIHTICNKSVSVVDMGRGFPCIVSEFYFMTRDTELGRGGPDHGIIADTEYGKSDDNACNNERQTYDIFSHSQPPSVWLMKMSTFPQTPCVILKENSQQIYHTWFENKKQD